MASYLIGKIDLSQYGFNTQNNSGKLEQEIAYLNGIPKQQEEYDEFGQGYWKNLSLYNASGEADDTQYRETEQAIPTEYMAHCPTIESIIQDHFNTSKLKMVRARNLIDGMVIPHRDFVELNTQANKYFRVFIAVEENKDAFHSDEKGVFQMKPGEVWFLDAAIDHAAINFSNKSRMFLCFDFVLEHAEDDKVIFNSHANIDFDVVQTYEPRQPLTADKVEQLIQSTAMLLTQDTFKDMLFALSKMHFIYDVPVREVFDWMHKAALIKGDIKMINKSKALKRYLVEARELKERFSINNWAA